LPPPALRRDGTADRLALAWSLAAAVALLVSLANQWLWFGVLVWLLLLLGVAIGYGPNCRHSVILATLTGVFLLYTGFLAGIVWTFRPDEEAVRLFLGVPQSTAFLLYGVWPCGTILGILYAVEFHRSVLPEDKLRRFLAEFGRKE
jgi:hypothetical protein